MAQVVIRDLPDEVIERLKTRAAAEGRSLETHLRIVLTEASQLGRDEFLALADSVAETTRRRPQTDATELIRASRDHGSLAAGTGASGRPDTSRRIEEILRDELG